MGIQLRGRLNESMASGEAGETSSIGHGFSLFSALCPAQVRLAFGAAKPREAPRSPAKPRQAAKLRSREAPTTFLSPNKVPQTWGRGKGEAVKGVQSECSEFQECARRSTERCPLLFAFSILLAPRNNRKRRKRP